MVDTDDDNTSSSIKVEYRLGRLDVLRLGEAVALEKMLRLVPDNVIGGNPIQEHREIERRLREAYSDARRESMQKRRRNIGKISELRFARIEAAKTECKRQTLGMGYGDPRREELRKQMDAEIEDANLDYGTAVVMENSRNRARLREITLSYKKGLSEAKEETKRVVAELVEAFSVQPDESSTERKKRIKREVPSRLLDPRKDDDMLANVASWKYMSFVKRKQRARDIAVRNHNKYNIDEVSVKEFCDESFTMLDAKTFRWWNKQRLKGNSPLFTRRYALLNCMVSVESLGCAGDLAPYQWLSIDAKHREYGVKAMLEFFGYEEGEPLTTRCGNTERIYVRSGVELTAKDLNTIEKVVDRFGTDGTAYSAAGELDIEKLGEDII